MPPGQRKRGQYYFKIWLPDGSSVAFESTRNADPAQFVGDATRAIAQITKLVDAVRRDLPTKDGK